MEKLRNKNAGFIVKFLSLELVDEDEMEFTYELPNGHENARSYSSLEKFKEAWEIYEPVEPLLEDEKIRKALRAVYDASPYRDNVIYFDGRWTFRGDKFEVMFDDREIKIKGWTEGKAYHIEELCGEEKE